MPESIPFAVPWGQLEKKQKVPAVVKKIRGKLNVPRERFWVTAAGEYRTVKGFEGRDASRGRSGCRPGNYYLPCGAVRLYCIVVEPLESRNLECPC